MIYEWDVDGVKVAIDLERWSRCLDKWQTLDCYGAEKYFHLHSQVAKFARLAKSAELTAGSLKILDISSGAGVWGAVLKSFGHNVALMDKRDNRTGFYADAIAALGMASAIPFHFTHVNNKYNADPLPEDIGEFDVISSIACAPMSTWGLAEYAQFIQDCQKHLNPGGFILLSPNKTGRESELAAVLRPEDMMQTRELTWFKINK